MNERLRRWGPPAAIVLLAIAVSFTSLGNLYAYDDGYIVAANERIRSLTNIPALFTDSYWGKDSSAGGYRPLTLAMFAIEWFIGGARPIVMHASNILLYAVLCYAVYALARRVLSPVAAWVAAALFAVHPVHVEAVANMVGQAELLTGIACVWGVLLYVRERDAQRMRWRVAAGVLAAFVVAVLAKENGAVFPLLLLAAELTIVRDPRPLRARFVTARPAVLLLILGGAIYLWVRALVLGDLAGMPPHVAYVGLHLTNAHRVLTMIGMAKEWARLLLWPWRLVAEYSPPLVPFAIEMSAEQIPGLLAIALTLLTFWVSIKRGWRDVAFGISWTIIAMLPISGFLFATGFILAERTMMLPSVGAMFAVVGLGRLLWARLAEMRLPARPVRLAFGACIAAFLVAGALRSSARQIVWRDNDILFPMTVRDAPTSYRAHQIMGAWLFATGFRGEGEREMQEAIRLFPYDPIPPYLLAEEYRKKGACDRALPLYKWSLATTDTAASFALGPYARCLLNAGRLDEARAQTMRGIARGVDVRQFRKLLRQIDSARVVATSPDSLERWLRIPGTRIPPLSRVAAAPH
ncbi:MAG TPA: tetratricopeptide repeat protein [Gemmatimonadaceae bacterium]|nr:tetratricopeptide repeat protein [Gemmatimonadaceae bacterium]